MIGYIKEILKRRKRNKEHAAWCELMDAFKSIITIEQAIVKLKITSCNIMHIQLQKNDASHDKTLKDIFKLIEFLEELKTKLNYQYNIYKQIYQLTAYEKN